VAEKKSWHLQQVSFFFTLLIFGHRNQLLHFYILEQRKVLCCRAKKIIKKITNKTTSKPETSSTRFITLGNLPKNREQWDNPIVVYFYFGFFYYSSAIRKKTNIQFTAVPCFCEHKVKHGFHFGNDNQTCIYFFMVLKKSDLKQNYFACLICLFLEKRLFWTVHRFFRLSYCCWRKDSNTPYKSPCNWSTRSVIYVCTLVSISLIESTWRIDTEWSSHKIFIVQSLMYTFGPFSTLTRNILYL
jgi:hypothetical protein